MKGLSREIQWKILLQAADQFWVNCTYNSEVHSFEQMEYFELNLEALINEGFLLEGVGGTVEITIPGLDYVGIPPKHQDIQLKLVQFLYENYDPKILFSLHKISNSLVFEPEILWSSIYYWYMKGLLEDCSVMSSMEIRFIPNVELFRYYNYPIEVLGREEIEPQLSHLRYLAGLRKIDSGGFGTIYTWFNMELSRTEAVKLLHDDQSIGFESLVAEARRIAQLKHPSIVDICDVARAINPSTGNHQPCLRLELIEGSTLFDELAVDPKPELKLRLKWLEQLLAALECANSRNVYHADLHSCNVLIDCNGNLVVIDFGGEKSSTFLATHKKDLQSSGLNGLFLETLREIITDREVSYIQNQLSSFQDYKKFLDDLKAKDRIKKIDGRT